MKQERRDLTQRIDGLLTKFIKTMLLHSHIALLAMLLVSPMLAQSPTPPATTTTLERGRELLLAHRLPEAEAYFQNYLHDDENSAQAHYLLAHTLLLENRPRESLAEFTRAAQIESPSSAELVDVSKAYVLLDDYPDAGRWLNRSLEQNPNDPEAWYTLGRLRYTQLRFDEAFKCFKRALDLVPRNVKLENNLGLALEGLNRTEEAVTAYRNALEWQAASSTPSEQPMINLAIVLIRRGETAEPLQLLNRALTIAPTDASIYEQLGHLYLQEADLDKASHAFEQAVRLSPKKAGTHFLLGKTYLRMGLKEKAESEFRQSSALLGTQSSSKN